MKILPPDLPENVIEKLTEHLKNKSNKYINRELEPPSKKEIGRWIKETLPKIYWPRIKHLVKKYRNSLPTVSHRMPDGRKTSARQKTLGQTFASPTWISADLGNSY